MIGALLLAAAPASAPLPSKQFVASCYERATNQAETHFCIAGEKEAVQHQIADAEETACLDADQSQQGMNRCEGEAYQRADKALNVEWAKIMAGPGADKDEAKLLLDAQRAWLKYRDAHCQAAAFDSKGGSIWPMLLSGCMAELTRQRTRELIVMGEGEGN